MRTCTTASLRCKLAAVLVLLAIWQLLSMWVGSPVIMPSPRATVAAMLGLVQTGTFWQSVATSFFRIALGFVLAVAAGILLAALAECSMWLGELLKLTVQVIKSVPVASFVILLLFWVDSSRLSTCIAFLIVLPVIFTNVRSGIRGADPKLLEMAQVFRLSAWKKIRYIYVPAALPAFAAACSVGLGFCWKAGIAAEVIGLPAHSVGSELYNAKLYLMTPELFAWTIVIVAISAVFEKVMLHLIQKVCGRVCRGASGQGTSERKSYADCDGAH